MYIVAGLGNPGLKYRHTRHNTGFDAIDTMAKALGCDVKKDECRAKTGSTVIAGQKVLLVKPQTFMNLSGESLQALCAYYKVNPEEGLIVISDKNPDSREGIGRRPQWPQRHHQKLRD